MMNLLYSMLGKPSALDLILKPQTTIQVRSKPTLLIKQLEKGGFTKFIAKINEKPQTPLIAIRKLSLIHYILIHYPESSEHFESVDLKIKTEDEWLNENIIRPYSVYLYKIINQIEPYCDSKLNKSLQISYNLLFYTLNMLKDLFPGVRKMSNLSRYYVNIEKQLKSTLTSDYVNIIAYEAQQMYNCFKAVLGEMISKPEKYIRSQAQKIMIKTLIEDELPKVNEEMKNLFLDKYYFPYGKGFGVKLLKQQELNEKNKELMESFYLLQERNINKKQKKLTLDKLLFGQRGHLNPQVLLSLSQIRQGDDSLNSSRSRYIRPCVTERFNRTDQKQQLTQNI